MFSVDTSGSVPDFKTIELLRLGLNHLPSVCYGFHDRKVRQIRNLLDVTVPDEVAAHFSRSVAADRRDAASTSRGNLREGTLGESADLFHGVATNHWPQTTHDKQLRKLLSATVRRGVHSLLGFLF